MLEWMQRHKKWLVVTIWISVIALVAAGMVGWNPNSLSLTGDNVAKVGNIKITQQEFNLAYQRIFNEYSQVVGDLDKEKAKQLGLDKIATNELVQKALLQNFATDIGIRIDDKEVVDTITHDSNFQKDGVFSNELYRNLLKENHISVKFFEESVRRSLLIEKLLTLLPPAVTPLEEKSISNAIQLIDTIEYKILTTSHELKTQISQQQLHDFWEQNKQNYINPPKLTLTIVTADIAKQPFNQQDLQALYNEDKSVYLDSAGKLPSFNEVKDQVQKDYQSQLAKKEAIRLAQKLKNDKTKSVQTKTITITLDDKTPQELKDSFNDLSTDSLSKPFLYNQTSYAVGKLINKTSQSIKSFQEAKVEILRDLKAKILTQELQEKAQKELPTFKGEIREIRNIDTQKIPTLDAKDTQFVIHNIFSSQHNQGMITLQNKIILYRIKQQRFSNQPKNQLSGLIQNIKSQSMDRILIDYLTKKYKIELYGSKT